MATFTGDNKSIMVLLSEKNATVNVVEEIEPEETAQNLSTPNKQANSSFDSESAGKTSLSASGLNGTTADSVCLFLV